MRLAIIGHSRAGKDEAAEMFRHHGLNYSGSISWHCKAHMARVLNCSEQYAWDNRHAHMSQWRAEIDRLRSADPSCIVAKILKHSDMVVGIRPRAEFEASRYMLDAVVWVERDVDLDPTLELTMDDADFVISNNSTIVDLEVAVADCKNDMDLWYTSAKKPPVTYGWDAPTETTSTPLQQMR